MARLFHVRKEGNFENASLSFPYTLIICDLRARERAALILCYTLCYDNEQRLEYIKRV